MRARNRVGQEFWRLILVFSLCLFWPNAFFVPLAFGEIRVTMKPDHLCTACSNMICSGQEIMVEVVIEGVEDLAGFQGKLFYPPEILSISQEKVRIGSFLSQGGAPLLTLPLKVDPTSGMIEFGAVNLMSSFSGSGSLVSFGFSLQHQGEGEIVLEDLTLTNDQAYELPVQEIGQCFLQSDVQMYFFTLGGGAREDLVDGRNLLVFKPSCSPYFVYDLLGTYQKQGRSLTIAEMALCSQRAYLFFDRPCGHNFLIDDNFAYVADVTEY